MDDAHDLGYGDVKSTPFSACAKLAYHPAQTERPAAVLPALTDTVALRHESTIASEFN
jgi:hypothetical protein